MVVLVFGKRGKSMWKIGRFECRTTLRQRSSYSLLLVWVMIMSLIFLLQKDIGLQGYTSMTGTIANLILYLVPLFMLIIGSFSIANELESGQWKLLSTYPLVTIKYIIGKMLGQFIAQTILFTIGYSTSILIGSWSGSIQSQNWIMLIYLFSIGLLYTFIVIGITIGSLVNSRWQALSTSIIIWFFLIMAWPTVLIAFLNQIPYPMINLILKFSLLVNPAEMLRILFVVKLGGGAVFGQSYDDLTKFLASDYSLWIVFLYLIIFSVVALVISAWRMERRKMP